MYRYKINAVCCLAFLLFINVFTSCKKAQKQQEEFQSTANIIKSPVKAPNFSLNTLEGNPVSLGDYNGKYVVIHIATTWCPFCNAEANHLETLYQNYKGKNVEVLIIDVKEPAALVKEKLKDKYSLSFPILLDINGEVAASFAPKDILPDLARDEVMLASNLLIDPKGNIQFMSLLDSKNFDSELTELKERLNELL